MTEDKWRIDVRANYALKQEWFLLAYIATMHKRKAKLKKEFRHKVRGKVPYNSINCNKQLGTTALERSRIKKWCMRYL
jgi:hypothetical protein